MAFLLLQSAAYADWSMGVLWICSLVLGGITLLLFAASLYVRSRHARFDRILRERREHFFPLVMAYLEGARNRESFDEELTGRGVDYIALEQVITDLLEHIEGEEVVKLQHLLELPVIANYHLRQLESDDPFERIKACNYISSVNLVTDVTTRLVERNLDADHQLLVFSAASAMMSSDECDVRARALRAAAEREGLSGMAVLEMFYKFHRPELEQMDEEARQLRKILEEGSIPARSLAYLVRGVAEAGYFQLSDYLLAKLRSEHPRWQRAEVLAALIRALGEIFNPAASVDIRSLIYHPSALVRLACAKALSDLLEQSNLPALYNLLYDPEMRVRFQAVKGLLSEGRWGPALLDEVLRFKPEILELRERAHV
ncbi:MAG: HEAT repeat domain-containing protein [Balneolaceae bacterium]|nr:HEAT repeat domain-containing protein [Balneolaceae bacterium]